MSTTTSLTQGPDKTTAIHCRTVAASTGVHVQIVSRIFTIRLIFSVAAIVLHGWLPAVHGGVVYSERSLSAVIDRLSTPAPGANGERFTAPVTSSPTMGVSNHNTLIWFDVPPQGIDWENQYPNFEYFAIRSADTNVRNVFISATDGNGGLTNAYHGTIAVKEVSLDNVNVNPQNNVLKLTGAPHVWTMNNSSYNGAQATPVFTSPFTGPLPLTFTASGNSTIDSWTGQIPSRTDLFVPGSSTFNILRSGDIASHAVVDSLRWSSTDGNTADINGSTLSIDHSFVTFATGQTPTIAGGVVTQGMVVRNGGTLHIFGSDGSDSYAHLRVEGGLLIDGSTLQVAQRGHLTVTDKLVLNNAEVKFLDTIRDSAIRAGVAAFQGTTTIYANNPNGYTTSGFQAGFDLANSSTVVNIAGSGPTFADGLFEVGGGTVNVGAGASLVLRSPVLAASSSFGSLNIASAGAFEIGENFTLHTGTLDINNEGTISVYGTLLGAGTLHGSGNVVVDGSNSLLAVASDRYSFTIDGDLSLLSNSTLRLALDPSAALSQHISVADLSISTPFGIPTTHLWLDLRNDTLLALRQKFLLVDYATFTAGEHFIGLADGTIFQKGLNWYKIDYADPAYGSSAITLTVTSPVPEPSSFIMALSGIVGGGFYKWRRRKSA